MRPIVVKAGPLAAADPAAIAKTQSPTAGPLTINGNLANAAGVAVMDNPREVLITTTADESANSFKVMGTDWAGSSINETIAGPNKTTAASVLSYSTVTEIDIAANAGGNLTVGTNGVGDSPWVRLDEWANAQTMMQCSLSGTGNYTVQSTLDDPNSMTNPVTVADVTWVDSSDTKVVGATTTEQTTFAASPTYVRVHLNSGSGSVTATVVQSNVANR